MGVRRDISCIFNNSLKESVDEFKKEIIAISADSKNSNINEVHNYTFSRYDDYTVITEIMYVMVYPNTIIFLWSPVAVATFLDEKLTVNGGQSGEIEPESSIIFSFIDLPNIEYLGSIFNMKGELFEAFTLKDLEPKENAVGLFEKRLLAIDELSVVDDDIIHVSMEFLKYQIEKFNLQIEASINSEDKPMPSIDENPFANEYYDHDILPIREKKHLGDQNV